MPFATRAGPFLGRRAPAPVVIHSAPLVLPIRGEPLRDGAVAVRGDRVLRVGPRAELLGLFAVTRERRWPGTLLPGLIDTYATGRHPDAPGSRPSHAPSSAGHDSPGHDSPGHDSPGHDGAGQYGPGHDGAGQYGTPPAGPRTTSGGTPHGTSGPGTRSPQPPRGAPEFRSTTSGASGDGVFSGLSGTAGVVPGFGVTTRAGVVGEPGEAGRVPDFGYVPVTSPGVDEWDERDRDLLITAIREVERPSVIGVAVHSRDLQVLEDVAVLARTFGLRLLVDLDAHSLAALDEAGILGAHCHATCSRSLDPGERKLLRLRHTAVALRPPPPDDALTLLEEGNLVALGSGGIGDPLAQARTVLAQARGRTPRPRGLDRKLVEAATLGGARALGLAEGAGRIGTLGPGSRADLAVFAAGGRYPYASLLDDAPCLGIVIGGIEP
ncbi:amidohydrolase family protein [Nonomuraea sediminis]|uniref:amidohydrolase family protein n=1 Tax=Nonomuraea sediminis TaxID=2835864 RepID=UPI001BDBE86D|nr:amidohydrolase family protein [Nonomuraea sediminis]